MDQIIELVNNPDSLSQLNNLWPQLRVNYKCHKHWKAHVNESLDRVSILELNKL